MVGVVQDEYVNDIWFLLVCLLGFVCWVIGMLHTIAAWLLSALMTCMMVCGEEDCGAASVIQFIGPVCFVVSHCEFLL